jgi:hypothetical protein
MLVDIGSSLRYFLFIEADLSTKQGEPAMKPTIERAKEIARGIDSGATWVDADLASEIAGLLELLAATVEAQGENLKSIEFALNYYSAPDLYHDQATSDVILDGGLRARTALGLLKGRQPEATSELK